MTKRGNGEHSLYQRSNGLWVAAFYVENARGERKRHSVAAKTKAAARAKMADALQRASAGQPVRDSADSIAAWVEHWTTKILPKTDRRPATVDQYRTLLRRHVVPALGARRLADLRPSHVEGFLSDLGESLAASTVRSTYAALRACIGDAVRDGLLARNVVEDVKRPRLEVRAPRALTTDQVRAILAATSEHRLHAYLVLIAGTGLRRGEAAALRWSDIDLELGIVRVERTLVRTSEGLSFGTPKTARGRRTLRIAPAVVEELRRHRVAQNLERLAVGSEWVDNDLVFCTELGTPLEPRNVSRWYAEACKEAQVSDTGLHALRHYAATAMLSGGVPVRTVADRLGHADVALTLNVYAATFDDHDEHAAAVLGDALSL
jgi:integrase